MASSDLSSYNHHVIANPKCACGDDYEDSFNYFFVCPAFATHVLLNTVSTISHCTIVTMLCGSKSFILEETYTMFGYLHKFIKTTKRLKASNLCLFGVNDHVRMDSSHWSLYALGYYRDGGLPWCPNISHLITNEPSYIKKENWS